MHLKDVSQSGLIEATVAVGTETVACANEAWMEELQTSKWCVARHVGYISSLLLESVNKQEWHTVTRTFTEARRLEDTEHSWRRGGGSWVTQPLAHTAAAEFWQRGVRAETCLDLTMKESVDICLESEFP